MPAIRSIDPVGRVLGEIDHPHLRLPREARTTAAPRARPVPGASAFPRAEESSNAATAYAALCRSPRTRTRHAGSARICAVRKARPEPERLPHRVASDISSHISRSINMPGLNCSTALVERREDRPHAVLVEMLHHIDSTLVMIEFKSHDDAALANAGEEIGIVGADLAQARCRYRPKCSGPGSRFGPRTDLQSPSRPRGTRVPMPPKDDIWPKPSSLSHCPARSFTTTAAIG